MSEDLDVDEITALLGIEPTQTQKRGHRHLHHPGKQYRTSGWFISTKGLLSSLDARVHLDWILDKVANKHREFSELIDRKYLVDVCVRWDSRSGHGGPTLSPGQMSSFGKLGVELWFDVYVSDFEEPD